MKKFSIISALVVGLAFTLVSGAWATQASLQFSGSVNGGYESNPYLISIPAELSGAVVGTSVAGTMTYDPSDFTVSYEGTYWRDYSPISTGNVFTFQFGTATLVGAVNYAEVANDPDYIYFQAPVHGCFAESLPAGWVSECFMRVCVGMSDALTSKDFPTSFTGPINPNYSCLDITWSAYDPNGYQSVYKYFSVLVDSASITPILPPPQSVTLAMAIKAGGDLSPINPKSNGVVPVALITTDDFDTSQIDVSTVRFGKNGTEAQVSTSSLEDVDADGRLDLVLQFRTASTGIVCGTTLAKLTGTSTIGQNVDASAAIKTVGCK